MKAAVITSLFMACVLHSLPLQAQESGSERPVTGFYSIEAGEVSALAEYLSPIAYSGTALGISGRWEKALPFCERHAMMQFDGRAAYNSLLNAAGTAAMFGVDAMVRWQMRWYARLPHNLTVSAGGGPTIQGGAMALLRNSNNPVNLTIKAFMGAGASLSWRSHIGRLPIVVEENLHTPLLGAFFMPQYGETFYEIYLGNTSGLAHFGWPGNMPGLDNTLSLSLDFGKTAMSVGYRLIIDTASANNLSTRSITNAFIISIIPDGLGMKRKTPATSIRPF